MLVAKGFHDCFFIVRDLKDSLVPKFLLDILDLGPLIETILSLAGSYNGNGPNPASFRTASVDVRIAVDNLARTVQAELKGVTRLSYAGLCIKRWSFFICPRDVSCASARLLNDVLCFDFEKPDFDMTATQIVLWKELKEYQMRGFLFPSQMAFEAWI
jgi:hypothetical protein